MLRVSDLVSAFDSAGALSSCNKGAIYRLWSATLRAAYPAWSGESSACLVDGNIGAAATAWATDPTTAATAYGNIGDWNTAAVSNMFRLFYSKPTFNAYIGKWNVASLSNMIGMLEGATAFNANIGSWNTASVSTMYSMFGRLTAFNRDIGSWNTARVRSMRSVFYDATAFNVNIGSWNVASVTTTDGMFYTATAFNQDISSWNIACVTNMQYMFNGTTAFNQDVGKWNTARVSTMASVRLFSHRLCVYRVGRALISPALLLPRRMAPRPCWHSLPVHASASMLWRTLRLIPLRRAHAVLCTMCGAACVLSLGRARCGHGTLV